MNKIILPILLLIFGSFGCQQLPSEEKKLYEEVMTIHDEVMPKTKDIYRKSKSLKTVFDGLTDSVQMDEVNGLISELDEADKSMFDWMAEFKKKDALDQGEDYLIYLASEKIKIQSVSDAMNKSLSDAEKYLNKTNNE